MIIVSKIETAAISSMGNPQWAHERFDRGMDQEFSTIVKRFDDVKQYSQKILAEYTESRADPRDRLVNRELSSYEHAQRVNSSFEAFAGERAGRLVRVAALLHDMFDRLFNIDSNKLTDETIGVAEDLLVKYFKESPLNYEEARYVCGLGIDGVLLERKVSAYRKDAASSARIVDSGEMAGSDIQEMISDRYHGDITGEVWSTIEPYMDFGRMFDILKDTNIETILVKGNELLDSLRNPSSLRQSAIIQDVIEAESVYAPILEVIKFDGLASALRDESHRIRLRMSARQDFVDQSEEHLDKIAKLGMDRVMSVVLGANVENKPAIGVDSLLGRVPIYLGEAQADGIDGEIYYRLKSTGSRANKVAHGYGEPMDDMAMTVVSEDAISTATVFADFIENRLSQSNIFEPKPSPSRSKAMCIKGSRGFVGAVESELVSRGIDRSSYEVEIDNEEDIESRGYEKLNVAKATFMATVDGVKVPTEIQFLTKDERSRMRRGSIAHIIYKYMKQIKATRGSELSLDEEREVVDGAVRVLGAMAERFNHLSPDSLDLNGRTVELAEEVLYMFLHPVGYTK